mmetsp:Transcript_3060/g.6333  ORF Transcript_3060/g.6333 Transcript_3060/m.6333 type:complete len:148 (-) Transcript_3060:29-472(-)|eukprot:CAMPEP_0204905702 /NCGR_PEP_ID=MMETSP1397-20131031/5568_1 /ASSEMBLY_ACC=CAM_ASM_000891 /TAXON_ID=49980 /ORGANISM="Climacostomum Climacostomum virens, Strain Stock W-24" /LENGTH=147 /DNA_ID=CAMNT_0052074615 /DNA_START=251 /DNA_END=694 /DNA_ORIENTATION=-
MSKKTDHLVKYAQARAQEASKKGPKLPLGPYTFYFVANREEVVRKNPDLAPTEIMRRLGKMWSATSEDERAPYIALFEKDSERYDRQMDEYEAEGVFYDDEGEEVKYRNTQRVKRRNKAMTQHDSKRAPPKQAEKEKGGKGTNRGRR